MCMWSLSMSQLRCAIDKTACGAGVFAATTNACSATAQFLVRHVTTHECTGSYYIATRVEGVWRTPCRRRTSVEHILRGCMLAERGTVPKTMWHPCLESRSRSIYTSNSLSSEHLFQIMLVTAQAIPVGISPHTASFHRCSQLTQFKYNVIPLSELLQKITASLCLQFGHSTLVSLGRVGSLRTSVRTTLLSLAVCLTFRR